MQKAVQITRYFFLIMIVGMANAQTTSPAPYCCGLYSTGNCAQPGPSNAPGNGINDFINNFSTTGGNTNISNLNSGCNGNVNNCTKYCSHYLAVTSGQTIVCTISSGNTFAQGFAMWVDWDQNNVYNTSEYVGGTAGVPAATTPTTITFVIPISQPNGTYSMRVRCSFATNGANITPCGGATFGETEDYTIFVGPIPPTSAIPSGTAFVNTPVCAGQALNFTLGTTYSSPLSYTWTGPGSFTSTLQNPSIFNPSSSASGIYTVLVSNNLCPITRTVSARVVDYPTFTVVPGSFTICQGGNLNATATMTTNPALNSYLWTSTAPGVIFNPQLQSTLIQPIQLPVNQSAATVIYSITVTPTLNTSCAVTKTMAITINNPLTPTLTAQAPLCNISAPVQLTAAPPGGVWSANPGVAPNGIFTPSLASVGATNSVLYSVSAGTCIVQNTMTFWVAKFHPAGFTSSVALACAQDPLFNLMNIVQDTTTGYWSGPQVNNNYFNPANLATGNYTLTHFTFSSPAPVASVCPSSSVFVMPVFNPPIPVIGSITPMCDNQATLALTATPPNGVWSGNPGVSSSGIRTPSLNLFAPNFDNNIVIYTAGIGTCVASSSKTFHLSRYNTAAFSGTVPHLCTTNNPYNLMGIVQNTNGVWSGINLTNNLYTPLGLPTNTYSLVYTTWSSPASTNLCPESKTITVSVLNPLPPNITQVGPLCTKGGPVQLSVNPSVGNWIPSTYLSSTGIFTPSLCSIGDNPVQYVIGTSTCNSQQTKFIKIEGFVSAAIAGSIPDQCNTNVPTSLVPLTLNNTGYWSGPGLTGSSFNPAVTGSGAFILNYQTASIPSGLCPDQATVAVNVFSLAAPSIARVPAMCNKSLPVQLQVVPVGGLFGSGVQGAVSSQGVFNPGLAMIGDNYVTYTISVGPCRSYAQVKIPVEEFISAGLSKLPDAAYCKNQQPFNMNSYALNPVGNWSNVLGNGLTGTIFDPSQANIGYNIVRHETFSSPTPSLCPDVSTVQIVVKDIPVVIPVYTKSGDCAPVEIFMNIPNTNAGKRNWNISDGAKYNEAAPTHILRNPGSYSILLTYIDDEAAGCSTQVFLPAVFVGESPKADFIFSPEELSIAEPEVKLTNISTVFENNRYQWNIQGHGLSNELHPRVKYTQPGNYKITLTATSIDGCKNEVSKMIEVKNDFKIYIPNSFTPNFDGMNDIFIPVFTPYGLDTKTFEMEIFDRWGHQLYHTKDLSKGWDGMIQGEVTKEGTYIFRIRYKDLDGKIYSQTGHMTLLRN